MNPATSSRFISGSRADSKRTDWYKAGSGKLCNVAKRSSNKGAQTPKLEVMLFLVFEVGLYLHTLLVPSSWPSGDTSWLIGKDGKPIQWQSRDGLLYSQCLAPGAQGTTVARLNLESSPVAEFDPGTYHKRFHCDKNKQKVESNGTYIVYCCTTASAEAPRTEAPGTDGDVWNELTQFRLWSKDKKHKGKLDWLNDAGGACDSDEEQKLIAALRDEESASDLALRQKCLLDYESKRPGARPVLEAHNPPADPENNSTCNTTVALFIKDPDTRKRQRGP
jgi:hypothetical protein